MSQLPPGIDLSKLPLLSPPKGQISNFINPPSLAPVAVGVGSLLIAIETILLAFRTCSNVQILVNSVSKIVFPRSNDFRKEFLLIPIRLGDICSGFHLWVFRPPNEMYARTFHDINMTVLELCSVSPIARHAWDIPLAEMVTDRIYKVC